MRITQKKFPEATADLEKARALGGNSPYLCALLRDCYAPAGRAKEARQRIEHLKAKVAKGLFATSAIASVYHGLGDKEQVSFWLDRAGEKTL